MALRGIARVDPVALLVAVAVHATMVPFYQMGLDCWTIRQGKFPHFGPGVCLPLSLENLAVRDEQEHSTTLSCVSRMSLFLLIWNVSFPFSRRRE